MKIIYFMPVLMREWAAKAGRKDVDEYSEFFSLLNANACIIDRTDSLDTPFPTESLYPIPKFSDFSGLTFADECRRHAVQLLAENRPIVVLYSGGLDSTTVLVSLIEAVQAGYGSFDQITVAATPHSIIENPTMWTRYVLPNFKLDTSGQVFANMGDVEKNNTRLLTGENGDQLFGSDVLLTNMHLIAEPTTPDAIRKFVISRGVGAWAVDSVCARLTKLIANASVELKTMGDVIWWLNFSCKWQSVTLRYVAFSKFIVSGDTLSNIDRLGTFFNTPQFQWLAMFGGIDKWGSPPALNNYKAEMRKYLKNFSGLEEYSQQKVKVPSLYRVFSIAAAQHSVLALSGDKIVSLNSIEELV